MKLYIYLFFVLQTWSYMKAMESSVKNYTFDGIIYPREKLSTICFIKEIIPEKAIVFFDNSGVGEVHTLCEPYNEIEGGNSCYVSKMSDVITLKGVENFIPKNIFEYEDFDHQKLLIAYREGCHNLHVFNYGQVDSTRNVDVKKLLLGESFELSLCNNGRLLCTVSDYSSFIIPQWIAAQFQYRVPTTVLVRRNDFTEGDIFRIKQEGACKSAVDLLKAQQDSILFDVSSVPVSLHGRVVIIQDDTTQSIDQIFCQYDPFFRSDFEGQRYAYFGHEGYVTRWKLVN